MSNLNNYRLYVTPLSPVHIGCGESYEPTNYIIEDKILHEFDTGSAMAAFSAQDRSELLKITDRPANGSEMIKKLQRFFYDRKDQLIPWAVNRIPVLPGIAELYAGRVGQVANREAGGGQVLNKLEIDRMAFNPVTREPVLFGSSFKGAIRTALLDHANGGKPATERKGLHELQGRLFRYRDFERKRLEIDRDPLRLIRFSDGALQNHEDFLPWAEIRLAVNRKKNIVLDAQGQPRRAMGENLSQILECIPAWHYRAFSLEASIQLVAGIEKDKQLPAKDFRFNMEQVANACNRFYLPLLTAEKKLLRERKFADPIWENSVNQCLKVAYEKISKGNAFILRVGRHSSAESMTLNGVRQIKIMSGRGQNPQYLDAAKTLWLAAQRSDQKENLIPFGWLLVEMQPISEQAEDWPELKNICEPHLKPYREIAEFLKQQSAVLEVKRIEQEKWRLKQEEAAQFAAAEKARKDQEAKDKVKKFNLLSEHGKKASELLNEKNDANKNKGKGHKLFADTRDLINNASDWSREDKALLGENAQLIFEHLGLKKDDYKKLLNSLKPPQ